MAKRRLRRQRKEKFQNTACQKTGQAPERLHRSPSRRPVINPLHTPLTPHNIQLLQRAVGNQAVSRIIQAKLKIGQPNDKYEQEADHVAAQVTRMPNLQSQPEEEKQEELQTKPLAAQITPLTQRQSVQRQAEPEEEEEEEETLAQPKLEPNAEHPVQRQTEEEEEEEKPPQANAQLQRQTEEPKEEEEEEEKVPVQTKQSSTPQASHGLQAQIHSLKGGGQPLSKIDRSFMERRFGADFSGVRVHTDSRAAESAKAVNAKAFTTGQDIAFGAGQYAPGTSSGNQLLAHELTHVTQQSRSNLKPIQRVGGTGRDKSAISKTGKPRINYRHAKRFNRLYAQKPTPRRPSSLGWADKLETVKGGTYKHWNQLWKDKKYNQFADVVVKHQRDQGLSGKDIDGVLGLKTWGRIAGLGETMAGIKKVFGQAKDVCTTATAQRIRRAHRKLARKFELAKDKNWNTYNAILQSIPSRMLDLEDVQYRGSGAAGAIVYAGLGNFVSETDIWAGKLKPGAAIQVWGNRNAYNLLRTGEIKEKGKKRRLTESDANFYGTSFVFIRYDTKTNERMLVRHYGSIQWKRKSSYPVWIAANVTA